MVLVLFWGDCGRHLLLGFSHLVVEVDGVDAQVVAGEKVDVLILYDVCREAESLGHARCYGSHGGLLLLELHGDQTHVELLLELE